MGGLFKGGVMADYKVQAVFFSKGVSGVDGIVVAETALSTVSVQHCQWLCHLFGHCTGEARQ